MGHGRQKWGRVLLSDVKHHRARRAQIPSPGEEREDSVCPYRNPLKREKTLLPQRVKEETEGMVYVTTLADGWPLAHMLLLAVAVDYANSVKVN